MRGNMHLDLQYAHAGCSVLYLITFDIVETDISYNFECRLAVLCVIPIVIPQFVPMLVR